MSALHEAVARAIADHDGLRGQLTWDEVGADWQAMYGRMAAAAIRVCMAEAQRAIEAERAPLGSRRAALSHGHGIDDALDVLRGMSEAGA